MAPQSCLLFCLFGALFSTSWAEGPGEDSLPRPRTPCSPGSFYHKKFCYEFFEGPASWKTAEASCVSWRNGHLASILTSEEGKEVFKYATMSSEKTNAWIGFRGTSTSEKKIRWKWSDGSLYVPGSFLWDNRKPPTTICNEECIALSNIDKPHEIEQWEQKKCDEKLPFICKYKAAF